MQDWTLLLEYLVTMAEEWLVEEWAWYSKDIMHDRRGIMKIMSRDRLLALEERHITLLKRMVEAQEQQATTEDSWDAGHHPGPGGHPHATHCPAPSSGPTCPLAAAPSPAARPPVGMG
ncbi:hypothetical protein Y1Q_0006399 [Alligator mississippiensis]|uniref:Uncharacterized protein n=1 Tax=Alligator mississippiensis TaxID=8496 RepID=A0A151NXP0_ALLMI|nr:hypothetical protein Y1Q_0006399 [Alligator mississippiensis]